jgi:hypothetical protein
MYRGWRLACHVEKRRMGSTRQWSVHFPNLSPPHSRRLYLVRQPDRCPERPHIYILTHHHFSLPIPTQFTKPLHLRRVICSSHCKFAARDHPLHLDRPSGPKQCGPPTSRHIATFCHHQLLSNGRRLRGHECLCHDAKHDHWEWARWSGARWSEVDCQVPPNFKAFISMHHEIRTQLETSDAPFLLNDATNV